MMLAKTNSITNLSLASVSFVDCKDFPIELSLIYKAYSTNDFEIRQTEEWSINIGHIDDVQGVVIAHASSRLVFDP